jgi:hypothetical protein
MARRLLGLLLAGGAAAADTQSASGVTVSGLSGGAFFAVQFHVAFSGRVQGVGALAGGPYFCALGNIDIALGRCMRTPANIDVSQLVSITRSTYTTTKSIDDPSNIIDDKVWVLSAEQDTVVAKGVVESVVDYYSAFVADPASQIQGIFNQSGEHAFLTLDQGSTCTFKGEPYINKCDFDAAGSILQHLYGGLTPPARSAHNDGLDKGQLLSFDQTPFLEPGYTLTTASLYSIGFMYVPNTCNSGGGPSASCRVHVVFHGCEQTVPDIGQQFALMTGYNSWAAANDIVILYPQADRSTLNPKGCFDWWGYTGPDYASQLGVQMQAVSQMITNVAAMPPVSAVGTPPH